MRGKGYTVDTVPCNPGITPAYAGKSGMANAVETAKKDHPRLCGEKAALSFGKLASEGSPPPMRGKALH